jgi:hypothetical protein
MGSVIEKLTSVFDRKLKSVKCLSAPLTPVTLTANVPLSDVDTVKIAVPLPPLDKVTLVGLRVAVT